MALDTEIKEQLAQYLELLENNIVLKASVGTDENSQKVLELVEEITSMSSKISMENTQLDKTPSFAVDRTDGASGVVFAGLPLGHEFTHWYWRCYKSAVVHQK